MRFNRLGAIAALVVLGLLVIQYAPRSAASAPAANPSFAESTLLFHAPPFDKIKDSDYTPAIEAGMKAQLAEIEAITDNPAPPTFTNTLEAMERSGTLLTRVTKVGGLTRANGQRYPTGCGASQSGRDKVAAVKAVIKL